MPCDLNLVEAEVAIVDGNGHVPPPAQARPLSEFVRLQWREDPNELLRDRFLCRGGGLLFAGPTGIGKSALAMQASMLWSIGRDCFGIAPPRPLTSVIIQAENDDGDLAEMRDGVAEGLKFTDEEFATACGSVRCLQEDQNTGLNFVEKIVRRELEAHHPDLLWIDPALAYLGGEARDQRDVGGFLRNMLNPVVHQYRCGPVILHHTNKPASGQEKSTWAGSDFAYLGSGSIEWANWARAIIALRGIGSNEVFELRACKRGSRLGWKDSDGATAYTKTIAHSREDGVIYWREADPDEVPTKGRPAQYDAQDLLKLLPDGGLTSTDWRNEAEAECGIKERRFYQLVRTLEERDLIIKSVASKRWQPIKK